MYVATKTFTYKSVDYTHGSPWEPTGDAVDERLIRLGFVKEVEDQERQPLPFSDRPTLSDVMAGIDETVIGDVVAPRRRGRK